MQVGAPWNNLNYSTNNCLVVSPMAHTEEVPSTKNLSHVTSVIFVTGH
jgi:hypothetical protein